MDDVGRSPHDPPRELPPERSRRRDPDERGGLEESRAQERPEPHRLEPHRRRELSDHLAGRDIVAAEPEHGARGTESPITSRPMLLNAFTTRAPGAQRATCSAPESVVPCVSTMPGPMGFVASIRIFAPRSPAARNVDSAPAQAVVSTSTSARAAASAIGSTGPGAPACFGSSGARTP
jgi:hypothetical protein